MIKNEEILLALLKEGISPATYFFRKIIKSISIN